MLTMEEYLFFVSGLVFGLILGILSACFIWYRKKYLKLKNEKEYNISLRKESSQQTILVVDKVESSETTSTSNSSHELIEAKLFVPTFEKGRKSVSADSIMSFHTAEFPLHNMHAAETQRTIKSQLNTEYNHPNLVQFKRELISRQLLKERHSDMILTRYLNARGGNIQIALELLIATEQWREDNNVNDILNFKFPEREIVNDIMKNYFHKEDKIGRVIRILEFGHCDYNVLISDKGTTKDRFLKYFIRTMEETEWRMQICYENNPKSQCQMMMIVNVKDAYLSQFPQSAALTKNVLDILLGFYPDGMGKLVIVNAPFMFTAIWRIISKWLDARTLSKVAIYGSKYEDELLELIDKENLPVEYGGICNCEGGCKKADLGIWRNHKDFRKWEDIRQRDKL